MYWMFKKLSNMVLTLFGVTTIIFFLFNVLPGDPAQMMLDQNENSEQLLLLKKKYGFDKPVFVQYLYYLNDLSPVSIHFNDKKNLSFLKKNKYNYINVLFLKNSKIVLKTPYLRESYQKNGVAVIDITVPSFKVPPGVDTTPPAPAFMVAVNCLTIISSSAEDEQDVKIKAIIEINILNFKFICFKFNYFF